MMTTNLGDLSRAFLLRQQSTAVKAELSTLAAELSSGRLSNLQDSFNGDFSPLASIEHSLKLNTSYQSSNRDAGQFAAAQQLALDGVLSTVSRAGADFLSAASTGEATQRATIYAQADGQLDQVISNLNTRFADRALFGGIATDVPPLRDAGTLLADLAAALSGATTASAVMAAADLWFDAPGGGFDTVAYQGSTTDLAPFAISEGSDVILDTRANAQPLKDVMKSLAVTTLMGQGLLSGNVAEQKRLLEAAGTGLMNSADDLTGLKAGIGYAEERIEAARIQSEAQAASFRLAQNALVGADPYETALRLKDVETQLQTVYTITARLSNLSLAAVLR